MRNHQLRRRRAGDKHGIGLGNMSLAYQKERGRHETASDEARLLVIELGAEAEDKEYREEGAENGWNAIGPDGVVGRAGKNLGGDRLHPIDAYGLLVARLVLQTRLNEVAGFDHLLGRLGEARLVAIERRQRAQTRQIKQEAQDGEHYSRMRECERPGVRKIER